MMNGEKQKFIGGVDFDELRAQRVQVYNAITVDLATARTNEEMVFTGNYIYALEATDIQATLDIRFNELFRAAIGLKKGRGVRVPFYRFYLTNTAQAGKTLTLAIGIEASDFEVFDVGKALEISGSIDAITEPVQATLDYYHTARDERFSDAFTLTPGAGLNGIVILKNEGAAGEKIFIEYVYVSTPGPTLVNMGAYAVDGIVQTLGKNMNIGSAASTIGRLRSHTPALTMADMTVQLYGRADLDYAMTLKPGVILENGERWAAGIINDAGIIDVSFIWREIS